MSPITTTISSSAISLVLNTLESRAPDRLSEITAKLKRLNPDQLALVSKLVDQMK